jgi:hypothetical protein
MAGRQRGRELAAENMSWGGSRQQDSNQEDLRAFNAFHCSISLTTKLCTPTSCILTPVGNGTIKVIKVKP